MCYNEGIGRLTRYFSSSQKLREYLGDHTRGGSRVEGNNKWLVRWQFYGREARELPWWLFELIVIIVIAVAVTAGIIILCRKRRNNAKRRAEAQGTITVKGDFGRKAYVYPEYWFDAPLELSNDAIGECIIEFLKRSLSATMFNPLRVNETTSNVDSVLRACEKHVEEEFSGKVNIETLRAKVWFSGCDGQILVVYHDVTTGGYR